MSEATHAVLIRGINVGGKNKVPMAALRDALAAAGLGEPRTYIQSGNVVVTAPGMGERDIEAAVERVLHDAFGVDTVVVAISAENFRAAVDEAPEGFGADDDTHKHDVIFLRSALPVERASEVVRARDGVDEVSVGSRALYIRRPSALVSKSYLPKVVSLPEYQDMTIRNWRTTLAVRGLLDA